MPARRRVRLLGGGVPELQAVVDIMARVKAGTTPKAENAEPATNDSQTDADACQSQGSQAAATEAACPPGDNEDDFMPVNVIESEEEQDDPVLVKAKELMAQELAFVSVHRSADK